MQPGPPWRAGSSRRRRRGLPADFFPRNTRPRYARTATSRPDRSYKDNMASLAGEGDAMENPYRTPQSEVKDLPLGVSEDGKRPALVWVIFLYAVFGSIMGFISTLLMITGHFPVLSETQRQMMAHTGPWQYALSIATLVVFLSAAVALFRLRKSAVTLFALYTVLTAAASVYRLSDPHYRALFKAKGPALVGGVIGGTVSVGIIIAMLAYSVRLKRRGILK